MVWVIQIAGEETRCCHMGYSFQLARVLLYASSHRQDSTYHKTFVKVGGFQMDVLHNCFLQSILTGIVMSDLNNETSACCKNKCVVINKNVYSNTNENFNQECIRP